MAITGSQKGLGLPPGLSILTFSDRAHKASKESTCHKLYLDLRRYRDSLEDGRGPFTLPVTLITGLRAALDLVSAEGIEQVWARHARQAGAVREAIWAIGLTCFAEKPSNVLTSVELPESIDGVDLMTRLKQSYGAAIAADWHTSEAEWFASRTSDSSRTTTYAASSKLSRKR